MPITLTSRDQSGQMTTVPYTPGDATPTAPGPADVPSGTESAAPGATDQTPAGDGPPSASPPETPTPGEREAPGETDDDEPLKDDSEVNAARLNRRFARLTRLRRQAERELEQDRQRHTIEMARTRGELDAVQRMLSGAAPPLPETPPQPTGPPQAEQFTSHEDYVLAAARYGAQQEFQARDEQTAQQRQQDRQRQFQQQLVERETAFKAQHPDYDDRVRAGLAGKVSPILQQALMLVPDGPAVAYALAQQPDLVQRLNTFSPLHVLVELGRLSPAPAPPQPNGQAPPRQEAGGSGVPSSMTPSLPTQAPLPAPPTPLSGAGPGTPTHDPASWSQAEFRKQWNTGWRPTPREFGR